MIQYSLFSCPLSLKEIEKISKYVLKEVMLAIFK